MSKTVVITGAAKGIGKAIAKTFAYSGYNVCINYNTSEEEAKSLCEELAKDGCNVIICKADVTDRKQVDKMIDTAISTFGNIDVLVNNAGISEYKLFIDIDEKDLKRMLDVNILGTFKEFLLDAPVNVIYTDNGEFKLSKNQLNDILYI